LDTLAAFTQLVASSGRRGEPGKRTDFEFFTAASKLLAPPQKGEALDGGVYCSKSRMAGFGSVNETRTNFEGETTYMTALPPMPPARVPLPFYRG
jgi:hypothetical protein